jgi:hypothetical protein
MGGGVAWGRVALCTVAMGLAGAAGAFAHEQVNRVNPTAYVVVNSVRYCSGTEAKLWDGNYNKGATRGQVFSSKNNVCGSQVNQPAQELKVKTQWMKRYSSGWGTCWTPGYIYNGSATWTFAVQAVFGSRFCGAGYYETWASGATYIAGAWRGGSAIIRSGSNGHYF